MASIYWVNLTTLILSFNHYSARKLLSLLFITFRWWVGCHKVLNFVHLSLFQQYIFWIYLLWTRNSFYYYNKKWTLHKVSLWWTYVNKILWCGNLQWFLTMCCQNNKLSYAPQFLFLKPQNTSLFHSLVLPDLCTSLESTTIDRSHFKICHALSWVAKSRKSYPDTPGNSD